MEAFRGWVCESWMLDVSVVRSIDRSHWMASALDEESALDGVGVWVGGIDNAEKGVYPTEPQG